MLLANNLVAKFGEFMYMEKLLTKGEIYMRPLLEFSKMEEDFGIGDEFENSVSYMEFYYPNIPKLEITNIELSQEDIKSIHLREYIEYNKGNIFSMSLVDLHKKDEIYSVCCDDKMSSIGNGYNAVVVITNYGKFINRVEQKAMEMGYTLYYNKVNYFQPHKQPYIDITPFDKRIKYDYQKEFRLFIETNENNPITMQIGDIRDIAFLVKAISQNVFP